jgi:hypothetical protein
MAIIGQAYRAQHVALRPLQGNKLAASEDQL